METLLLEVQGEMKEYVFLTKTFDNQDKILALKSDIKKICKACETWKTCKGADIEDGCGCLIAFCEICYLDKPIFYESDLK